VFKKKNFKRIAIIILVTLLLVGLFFLLRNQNFLRRRLLRQFQDYVLSFGPLAPIIIILMIFLNTLIPPLPIPIPMVELASGVIFGFWGGWIVAWFGQIISSFSAFAVTRFLNKTFLSKWINNKRWSFYQEYLNQSGTKAILITRGTMTSPFNIISFLAGTSSMSWVSFLWATALGVIPETVLYVLIGSQLRYLHIRLIWLSTIILAISLAGVGLTFLLTPYIKSQIKKNKTILQ